MEDAPPSFFKFIMPPSGLRKLSIPSAFTKKHGSSFLDHAHLRAPGGLEHIVDLKKLGDFVWFSNGWKEFAESYSIALGHFLVFNYHGNSRFEVLIYDKSACEIDYPSFDMDEDVGDDGHSDDDGEESMKNVVVDTVKGQVVMSPAYINAEAFQCDHPSFIVAMNISYLEKDYRMWVPLLHAQRYLKGAKEAVLQVGPRVWIVNVTRGSSCFRFSAGWAGFVLENRLEVDDVCKFELVDRRAHTYQVHIFRRHY